MKKRHLILNIILLVLFLGVRSSQYAQEIPTDAEKSDRLRHEFALSLLRAVNVAEVVDYTTYGSFSSWLTLLSRHSEYFGQFIAVHRRQLPNAHFADLPEILPGWNLRMKFHADGQGYDVLLRDTADEKCG